MIKYNEDYLMKVLTSQVISNKSKYLSDKNNKLTFFVSQKSNKHEIKLAMELIFKIKINSINVLNYYKKKKFFSRKYSGYTNKKRIARISLSSEEKIKFNEVLNVS